VDKALWSKNWQSWLEFCSDARCDTYLQQMTKSVQQNLLIGFTARVRRGYFGKGAQVQAQTPETALRHVAQTSIVLAGYAGPRRSYGCKDLDLPFSRLMKTYKCDSPAPQPQLALPARAIPCVTQHYYSKNTPTATALADLITIAFFFLLQPGEYAMPTSRTKTRTVQFRRQDVNVRFFKTGQVVQHSVPLAELRQAGSVRLYIDNQKNGQRGSTMHHTATLDAFCPVKALANRVHTLHAVAPQDARLPISLVPNSPHITATDVTRAVRESVLLSGLLNAGYSPTRVSPTPFVRVAPWR
jgi:hypothetical protein